MKERIRVLQINKDLKKGGVQSEIMYPARILDKNRVHFDVMLLSDTKGYYEKEFLKYGKIFRIPLKRRKTKIGRALSLFANYFVVKRGMERFFKAHEQYDAVHGHDFIINAACMAAAKKCGVPVRVAYCALNDPGNDRLYVKLYLFLCSIVLNRCCTHKYGVTQNAADYVFGKNKGKSIKNPTLDFEKFNPDKYSPVKDDRIHLLMVGSFSSRKNQKFAVDILQELVNKGVYVDLTFIGYPRSETETYLPELRKKVAEKALTDKVFFLPQDADIPKAMSEATVLLIPSIQEGLPNVALEAQRMGTPCFISTNVSNDCDCGNCLFLPLNKGAGYWAGEILNYVDKNGFEKHFIDMSEWDNRILCEMYMDIWSGKNL